MDSTGGVPSTFPLDGLPKPGDWELLLGGLDVATALPYLERSLMAPARDLLGRPSKRLRARLVRLAFALVGGGEPTQGSAAKRLALTEQAVELLHAGSLIIDDIQDGSPVRRGGSALHYTYGLSSALCTGNWLYFWPLRLISGMELSTHGERLAYRLYHRALERAHYGQALDLGVTVGSVELGQVEGLCRAVGELKTGAITALAVELGALAAGADPESIEVMGRFGCRFGTILQALDDLGNAIGSSDPAKKCEDLRAKKPSALWAAALRLGGEALFHELFRRAAGCSPEDAEISDWLSRVGITDALRSEAEAGLREALFDLAAAWPLPPDDRRIGDFACLGEQLLNAYS